MKLSIHWDTFLETLNNLITESDTFNEISPTINDIESLDKNELLYKEYNDKVLDFLTKSFGGDTTLSKEYKHIRLGGFNQTQPDFYTKKKNFISLIQRKKSFLIFNRQLLSISDAIIKENNIETSKRAQYSSEEILDLIIYKLYDLYDDNSYPLSKILTGNGIVLKRNYEHMEYANILEQNGYINSNQYGGESYVQLSVQGKLYVEEKRKAYLEDYNSINNNAKDISDKVDEIITTLRDMGLGQEILFNEIEELKELYTTLNKKNWAQVVKGKIVDLSLSQIINVDVAKHIYEELTNNILRLP